MLDLVVQPKDGQGFSDILERISDAFVALDANWCCAYVNGKAAETWGRKPEDLIGRHLWTEFPERVGQPLYHAFHKAMADQRPLQVKEYDPPNDRWFEHRIYPSPQGLSVYCIEITERKKAEGDSFQTKRIYEDLYENAPDMFLSVDAETGNVIQCNKSLNEVTGYSKQDITGRPVIELYHPDCHDAVRRALEQFRMTGEVRNVELQLRCNDGGTRDVSLNVSAVRDPAGKILYSRSILRDITDQKRAETLLRYSEERYRALFDHAPDGFFVTSPDGHYIDVNRAGLCMLGYERSEFLGMHISDIVSEAEVGRVRPEIEEVKTGRTYYKEWKFKRNDGSEFVGEVIATVMPDGNLLGITRDITDRKRMEKKIRASEANLEEAQARAHLGSWELDLEEMSGSWSKEMFRLHGRAVSEGTPSFDEFLDLVHPKDRQRILEIQSHVIQSGEAVTFEYRTNPDHSAPCVISTGIHPILDDRGRVLRLVGTGLDITDRKRAAEALQKAYDELERRVEERTSELSSSNQRLMMETTLRQQSEALLQARNEDLKAFTFTVSHDLKAPLRGIAGYAQELTKRHRTGLSDRALFCLDQMITATANLNNLIDDLLRYSRIERETRNVAEVDLPAIVREILHDRLPTIEGQCAEISVAISFGMVRCWEQGMKQVLANLIDNALKYSRQSSPPRIAIRGEEFPDRYRMSVADNGIGFEMKYHDRLFDLFYRLVRQDMYEGTGAGLAIVKKAMEKQGGNVWAESIPKQGTTFYVEWPKARILSQESPP